MPVRAGLRLRARIGLTESEQPCLSLFDQEGRERIVLRLEADGSPVFELRDKDGAVLFRAPCGL